MQWVVRGSQCKDEFIKMLGDIYHLETTDFNRWAKQTQLMPSIFFSKTSHLYMLNVMFLKRR
jgi:hypothetical protein